MACDSPYYTENPLANLPGELSKIPVACGRCYSCQKLRSAQWCFRMKQEDKVSNYSMFVTLTYDSWSLPRSDGNLPTLVKSDLQGFIKRYRKANPEGTKIKYYAVGEYGTNNWRPHYHIILFNSDNDDPKLVEEAWMLKPYQVERSRIKDVEERKKFRATRKEKKQERLLLGIVDCGTVSGASIAYTTKYLSKTSRIPRFLGDDRLKEFSLMSLGLGKSYVNDQTRRYHTNGLVSYVVDEGGVKIPIPRYYKNAFFDDSQKGKLRMNARIFVVQLERKKILEAVKTYGAGVNLERLRFAEILNNHRKLESGDINRKI